MKRFVLIMLVCILLPAIALGQYYPETGNVYAYEPLQQRLSANEVVAFSWGDTVMQENGISFVIEDMHILPEDGTPWQWMVLVADIWTERTDTHTMQAHDFLLIDGGWGTVLEPLDSFKREDGYTELWYHVYGYDHSVQMLLCATNMDGRSVLGPVYACELTLPAVAFQGGNQLPSTSVTRPASDGLSAIINGEELSFELVSASDDPNGYMRSAGFGAQKFLQAKYACYTPRGDVYYQVILRMPLDTKAGSRYSENNAPKVSVSVYNKLSNKHYVLLYEEQGSRQNWYDVPQSRPKAGYTQMIEVDYRSDDWRTYAGSVAFAVPGLTLTNGVFRFTLP